MRRRKRTEGEPGLSLAGSGKRKLTGSAPPEGLPVVVYGRGNTVQVGNTHGTVLGYAPADGAGYDTRTAEVLGTELESIQREGKEITPQELLHRATDPAHALHGLFEWRDDVAAEKYRIAQARGHINHLVIRVQTTDGEKRVKAAVNVNVAVPVRVVVPGSGSPDSGTDGARETAYVPLSRVQSDECLRAQLVAEARRYFTFGKDKYQSLGVTELSNVYAAIDAFLGD